MLGPAPANCPTVLPPQEITLTQPISVSEAVYRAGSTLYGIAPVWLASDGGMHLGGDTPWPYLKIQILVEPQYTNYVTVQVVNIQTGQPLLVSNSGYPPDSTTVWTSEVVSDFRGAPTSQWKEIKVFPFVPQAGCYRLLVTWQGGQWNETHAVGR